MENTSGPTEVKKKRPTPVGFSNTSLNRLNMYKVTLAVTIVTQHVTVFPKIGYTTSKVSLDLDTLNPQ